MLIITSDNLKVGARSILWDITPEPLQQFNVLPIDFHHVVGRIFDEHGEYDCDIDVIIKIGMHSSFMPISSSLAVKIFRDKTEREVDDLFEAQNIAANHGLAPKPYKSLIVKHKNNHYRGIVQERLRCGSDFKIEMKEVFDIETVTGKPSEEWLDDAFLLWHFIKYSGPSQDKVKNKTVRYIIKMREDLKKAGLMTEFHEGEADEGDVTAHNLVWSNGLLKFVDFDWWIRR